jgi:two-component system, chemotaxis family, protein-glutamate methylesterase/glutaminase
MLAIKRSGGTCIVQDPNEAEYPDMPLSVLNNMEVDYCINLADMGEVIAGITETTPEEKPAPHDVIIESQIAERVVVDYENVMQLGEKSIYACPDCGGGLCQINKGGDGQGKDDGTGVISAIPIQRKILLLSRKKYLNLLYRRPYA